MSQLAKNSNYQKNEAKKIFWSILMIPLFLSGYFLLREIQLNNARRLIEECEGDKICQGRIEALSKLVLAKRSLQSYKLGGANLLRANLSDANLNRANLTDAYLYNANLTSANLSDANLTDANFTGANLLRAYLDSANLDGAYLDSANFTGANLTGANLDGAYLDNANLTGANLTGANLDGAYLTSTNLDSANLTSANLIQAYNIRPSQLKSACYWDKAVYKGHFDENQWKWVINESDNQEYIEQLQQDQESNPSEPVDCTNPE